VKLSSSRRFSSINSFVL